MSSPNEQRTFEMLGRAVAAELDENPELAAQLEPLLVERLKGMDLRDLLGLPKQLDAIARQIEVAKP